MTTLRGGGAEVGQWLTAIGSLVARLSEPGSIEVSTLADRPSAGRSNPIPWRGPLLLH